MAESIAPGGGVARQFPCAGQGLTRNTFAAAGNDDSCKLARSILQAPDAMNHGTTAPILEIDALSCVRGDRVLFRDLSFEVRPAELLHLKGRNGSGKTTLLRALAGLLLPESGEVRWGGSTSAACARNTPAT